MYNPYGKEPDNEWIEIYNLGEEPVDLSLWYLSDDPSLNQSGKEGCYQFPKGTNIKGKGFLVVAYNGTAFFLRYGFYPDFEIINSSALVKDMIEVRKGLVLSNYGDDVHLFDSGGIEVDSVWYGNGGDVGSKYSAKKVKEGSSLARYQDKYSGKPAEDFYEEFSPSPGKKNKSPPIVSIDMFPRFIPRVYGGYRYGMPFAVKVTIRNFEEFRLKIYVARNASSPAASQVWNGKEWTYSGNHVLNGSGNWSGWLALRLARSYKGYGYLANSSKAFLVVKVVDGKRRILKEEKEIRILDIRKGGLLVGRFRELKGLPIIIKKGGDIYGIYISENNSIDEGYPSEEGFYKLVVPPGKYELIVLYKEDKVLLKREVKVSRGIPDFSLYYKNASLYIYNTGYVKDNYTVICKGAHVIPRNFSLRPGEGREIELLPKKENISVKVVSGKDPSLKKNLVLKAFEKKEKISVRWIKLLVGNEEVNECYSGEILKVKASIKNNGEIAKNVKVTFLLDNRTVLERDYSSIGKYPKYPSVEIDTSFLEGGRHRIDVYVNSSLRRTKYFFVRKMLLQPWEKKLIIVELHPHDNEYISIYNPTPYDINLSTFYITNTPERRIDKQNKLLFPPCKIHPLSYINISYNATAYRQRKGFYPDFEYGADSEERVPNLICKGFKLNDAKGVVCIKSKFNQTIDTIVYGNLCMHAHGWKGEGVKFDGDAVLKRKKGGYVYFDTNSSEDWILRRESMVKCKVVYGKLPRADAVGVSSSSSMLILSIFNNFIAIEKVSFVELKKKGIDNFSFPINAKEVSLLIISSRKYAEKKLIDYVSSANKSLYVAGFPLRLELVGALLNAASRGVTVKMIEKDGFYENLLRERGIDIKPWKNMDTDSAILIIDNKTVFVLYKNMALVFEDEVIAEHLAHSFLWKESKSPASIANVLFVLFLFACVLFLVLKGRRKR